MSKVFRLHTNGANTYKGWNKSQNFPYDATARDTIEDPNGATARQEITSIPSLFARIDLAKNAFREVVNSKNLKGNTIYHKIVSDCLDIGQIFFNIDQYSNLVKILVWNKEQCLRQLKTSNIPGHKIFADVFNKYWESDGGTYNFANQQNFYLLEYLGEGKRQLDIIGATSPATLFFSTANDLSYVSKNLRQGEDKFFDDKYASLDIRDFEYVKMLWTLKNTIPQFANLFPEINDYLELCYGKFETEQKTILDGIKDVSANDNITTINVQTATGNNDVEVFGHNIFKKKNVIVASSDFTIETTKNIQCTPLPMVLPVTAGNKYAGLQYTVASWGNTNKAPFCDETTYTQRRLPNDGRQQAYLTISDFLEPYLIRVSHKINENEFFNPCKNPNNDRSYLLPITERFFEFFSTDDLQNKIDGQPMIDIVDKAGGAQVLLRIPIKGKGNIKYMEYSRLYADSNVNNDFGNVDVAKDNMGSIVSAEFDAFVMPMIKFNNEQDAHYRVGTVHAVDKEVGLALYDDMTNIPTKDYTRGNNGTTEMTTYVVENKKFNSIKISLFGDKVKGFIVPKFQKQQNVNKFKFAIDFGTSNTCIAYNQNGQLPQVFSYNKKDNPISSLFLNDDNRDEFDVIYNDILPDEIAKGSLCYFPTRTVIAYSKSIDDWAVNIPSFAMSNINMFHNKKFQYQYNATAMNLKWGTDNKNAVLIDSYIDGILFMLRNKVLLEGGDLGKTEIIWFYPASMPGRRLGKLRKSWGDAIKKYFGNVQATVISESVAPTQFIINNRANAKDIVTIDIGGGTTDIAYSSGENIIITTSVRFAGDDLFKDPFAKDNNSNGIIDYFAPSIKQILDSKDELKDLSQLYSNINRPEELASFVFGLKNHTTIRELNINQSAIDMDILLQDSDDFRIVFILFYSAIIYHIANIIKCKDLSIPGHINLGGNGSKNIRIITNDKKLLASYTKILFELVFGKSISIDMEIMGLGNNGVDPKEITCLGGINCNENMSKGDKVVLKCNNELVSNEDTIATVDDKYKENVVEAVKSFFNIVLEELPKHFNLNDNFGISSKSMEIAKEICYNNQDIQNYIDRGISELKTQIESDSEPIPETLFFYPIKGTLNELSLRIKEQILGK